MHAETPLVRSPSAPSHGFLAAVLLALACALGLLLVAGVALLALVFLGARSTAASVPVPAHIEPPGGR
jgi:hypothetical protein